MDQIGEDAREFEGLLVHPEPSEIRVVHAVQEAVRSSFGHSGQLGEGGVDVADLDPAVRRVDRDTAALRPGIGVVVRQDLEEGVEVTAFACQNDAPPEQVDPDRAEPVVTGVLDRLRVDAGMGGLFELAEGLGDTFTDGRLQPGEVCEKVLVDSQLRNVHRSLSQIVADRRLGADEVGRLSPAGHQLLDGVERAVIGPSLALQIGAEIGQHRAGTRISGGRQPPAPPPAGRSATGRRPGHGRVLGRKSPPALRQRP